MEEKKEKKEEEKKKEEGNGGEMLPGRMGKISLLCSPMDRGGSCLSEGAMEGLHGLGPTLT